MTKSARIIPMQSEFGEHYTVNMIDENGKVVFSPTTDSINEAEELRRNWLQGDHQFLSERAI